MTVLIDWTKYAEVYNKYNTGVYGVVNFSRQRVYVGATYLGFPERWSTHRSQLEHDLHPSRSLQKDWWLDGPQNFAFLIFQELSVFHPRMDIYEQFWLDCFREAGLTCYNSSKPISRHVSSKDWLTRQRAAY